MTDKSPDGLTLIGLHRLAAQNGDGLAPELYELLMRRAEEAPSGANVTQFPILETRFPGEKPEKPLDGAPTRGENVIAFAPRKGKSGVARRKRG
jgi:hypothetical protein